jgi:serine/threonine protein phosphatase PrpC
MQLLSDPIVSRITRWLARPAREIGFQNTEYGSIATSLGEVRKDNQDRVAIVNFSGYSPFDSFTAWLLCDGIGGMREGDAAAEFGIASVISGLIAEGNLIRPHVLERIIQQANRSVYQRFKEKGGSTISIVLNTGNGCQALSVGDSRIYRQEHQNLVQLTSDDNLGNQLRLLGGGSNSSGGFFSHQLSQYLGVGGELVLKPISNVRSETSKSFLLTTDGVHSLEASVFQNLVVSAPSTFEVAKRLVYVAKWCGGRDNASVICVPANFPNPITQDRGLLEIWDPFGKIEIFVTTSSRKWSVHGVIPQAEKKLSYFHSGPQTLLTETGVEPAKSRRRKGQKKQPKGSPKIEITEDIERPAP